MGEDVRCPVRQGFRRPESPTQAGFVSSLKTWRLLARCGGTRAFSHFGTILPVRQYPLPLPLFFRIIRLPTFSPQTIPNKGGYRQNIPFKGLTGTNSFRFGTLWEARYPNVTDPCPEPVATDCQRTVHRARGRVRDTSPQRSRRAASAPKVTQDQTLSRSRRYRSGNCTFVTSRRQGNRQAWPGRAQAADVERNRRGWACDCEALRVQDCRLRRGDSCRGSVLLLRGLWLEGLDVLVAQVKILP